jgi:AcrR family transcriptional regulator
MPAGGAPDEGETVDGTVIPIGEGRGTVATKERILDAAEALFMQHGFEATSLRAITNAAAVNLAAVNYHFGSKEELFQAVLTRRLDPMNQRRVALLTELERAAAPDPVPCDRILSALFLPALELARDPARGGQNFLRLLGRAYADPAPFIRRFLSEQYAQMIMRFKLAFGHALPELPKRELSWRLHFMMGALSYTLAGTDALKLIAELAPTDSGHGNDELLLQRLAPFLLAGLTSPLPDLTESGRALDGALAGPER